MLRPAQVRMWGTLPLISGPMLFTIRPLIAWCSLWIAKSPQSKVFVNVSISHTFAFEDIQIILANYSQRLEVYN